MSNPIFTPRGTVYDFTWEKEQISIQVTRIKEHREGRITAELKILTTKPEFTHPHLHQAQFNLSSSQARTTLGKLMIEKYNENNIDWAEILEQVCVLSLEAFREGEPISIITTEEELPPLRYLIYPLIPEMQPTILYGEKGVAKSYLALLSYLIVSLPWKDNPLGLGAPETPIKALLLDWETERNIIGHRFQRLCRGMNLPYMELNYLRCVNPMADDMDGIQKRLHETQAQFLIVDSLTPACGGEVNAKQALDFFKALRTLRVSSFIIAQTPKLEDRDSKTIFGSALFTYLSRCIWEAKKGQGIDETSIEVGLFHKYANEDRLHAPLGYSISFESDTVIVEQMLIEKSDLATSLSASLRIKNLLKKEGAKTVVDMVEILGLTKNNVTTTCYRLRDKGVLVKMGEEWGMEESKMF